MRRLRGEAEVGGIRWLAARAVRAAAGCPAVVVPGGAWSSAATLGSRRGEEAALEVVEGQADRAERDVLLAET